MASFWIQRLLRAKDSNRRSATHGKSGRLYYHRIFLLRKITSIPEESKVSYQSKNGKDEKVFDALEMLPAMYSLICVLGDKIVMLFLSKVPYIVVPFVLRRSQYSAINIVCLESI
jgi:hypothetical protein